MGLGQNLALGVGVVALGTVYVLLHEARQRPCRVEEDDLGHPWVWVG